MPTCSRDYSGTVLTDDCIANASPLPSGVVDSAYSETLTAPSLAAPLVWLVLNGTLPDGLELGEDTGEIFGVPTLVSNYSFQVQVTDTNGVQCLKDFTLDVTEAGDGCGWWNDFPFAADPSSFCVPPASFTPTALTGATLITAETTLSAGGCYLRISGTKNYTGPAVILKIRAEVTGGAFPSGSISGTGLASFFLNGIGVQEVTVEIPESAGDNYEFFFEWSNTVQGSITLTSCESTIGASDGFFLVPAIDGGFLWYYATTGVSNPSATVTIASNKPITWDVGSVFPDSIWVVAPTITLDGVPLTLNNEFGNWVFDFVTIDTDACVVKTFVISGPTVGLAEGAFSFVPQS